MTMLLSCNEVIMDTSQSHIAAGYTALNIADWASAKACFEASLSEQDTPEAHDGLGIAYWWLNQIDAAHRHRSTAYIGYKQRGDSRQAARIAAWIAREQVFLHANVSAMNGWFARAERLLQQDGSCSAYGWYAIFRASMLETSAQLEQTALHALTIARAGDDADLEAVALAFGGMARVALGQVDDGMMHLDEAMTMVTAGEVASFMVISEIFCVLLSACALAGDLVRTEHWCHAAAAFAQRYHCSFLSAYCRTTYGGLLAATGRWQEAETELSAAIQAFEHGHRALRVHAVLQLADLRSCQGRLEEAEALLAGYEDYGAAVVPRARIHLARGEANVARAVLEQALPSVTAPTLEQAPLLLLLVDVLLTLGDITGAGSLATSLIAFAQGTRSNLLLAQAEFVTGRVKQCAGEPDATQWYQAVLARMHMYEQSILAGRARLAMAHALKATDNAGAVAWARAALATFERIGTMHEADEAAQVLRELGVVGRIGPRQRELLTQRETEVLSLVARGLTNREIAARLVISAKTVEHHVSQIFGKLGLHNRAEAAAFASSNAIGGPARPL
jgi:ATP/maltotriose-dependent transcriptional regulator MalT